MTLYISGYLSEDRNNVVCPLQSSVVLFIIKYCQAEIDVVFVSDDNDSPSSSSLCTFSIDNLSGTQIAFSKWQNVTNAVRNVSVPSVHQPEHRLVRSGLCVVLRHIIQESHNRNPSLNLIDLLGFRKGSMKMCAEVSSWTKLCEVDIPYSLAQLIGSLIQSGTDKDNTREKCFTIPSELMTLENHFQQKCRVHNDNKRQRAGLTQLKEFFTKSLDKKVVSERMTSNEVLNIFKTTDSMEECQLDSFSFNESQIFIQQTIHLDHGVRRFVVKKRLGTKETDSEQNENKNNSHAHAACDNAGDEKRVNDAFDVSALKAVLSDMSFTDIEYEHMYSEGYELTVADLILVTYIYHLLDSMDFAIENLSNLLPCVLKWTSHMFTLGKVKECGQCLGWDMERLDNGSNKQEFVQSDLGSLISFQTIDEVQDEEIELSRNTTFKHRASKPEVLQAINKFEVCGIKPLIGTHPKGDAIQVDWDSLPDSVHPKEGHVPLKRTLRKCQQLENLATAVVAVAKPGDIVVDFCSGGGHLGILCAFLLPQCQIYLVENKEESLLKSSCRLQALGLQNVTLYQCNMDYFIGKFGVGLCLHACGSATDMVLELCTKSQASFVICPCCYGHIQNTHLLSYPRSNRYLQADISYTDFLTVGHAADQTEFDIKLEKQGRTCMNLVDTDRAEFAKENGYDVSLCSLKPLTCSPKNNLLIGTLRNS